MVAYITKDGTGFLVGAIVGFIITLGLGIMPIWVFFAMIMSAIIYFVLKPGSGGE